MCVGGGKVDRVALKACVQSVLSPCYHIRGEAEDERADEDANFLGGALPPLLLLSQTPLLHTDGAERHINA